MAHTHNGRARATLRLRKWCTALHTHTMLAPIVHHGAHALPCHVVWYAMACHGEVWFVMSRCCLHMHLYVPVHISRISMCKGIHNCIHLCRVYNVYNVDRVYDAGIVCNACDVTSPSILPTMSISSKPISHTHTHTTLLRRVAQQCDGPC